MTLLARDEIPEALGSWSDGGSLGVHLWPDDPGEPSPRLRLVLGRRRVPRGADESSLRSAALAMVPERVRAWSEAVELPCDGGSWTDIARGARVEADQLRRRLAVVGGPEVVFVADLDQLTERLADLPSPARSLLEHVDGVRTVLSVLARSPLPLDLAARSLLRLRDLGVLMVGSREPVERESVVSPEPLED